MAQQSNLRTDPLDSWRLCDELSIVEAALLFVGEDPSIIKCSVENLAPEKRPNGYDAAKVAIAGALLSGRIFGKIVQMEILGDQEPLDLHRSCVEVAGLKGWLAEKGIKSGFFFPEPDSHDFLDPNNPRYARKLAAAVRAWRATGDELTSGRSPKQVLANWLRKNAAEFGLCDEDGKPNETGIEEIAKVANWQPSGGAPRTPTG